MSFVITRRGKQGFQFYDITGSKKLISMEQYPVRVIVLSNQLAGAELGVPMLQLL